MSWLTGFLASAQKVLPALGSVVDAAVPLAVGDRTKWSVAVATLAPVVGQAACTVYPPACPFLAMAGQLAAFATPLFAFAGVVRPAKS
jgi:hypothetical protein